MVIKPLYDTLAQRMRECGKSPIQSRWSWVIGMMPQNNVDDSQHYETELVDDSQHCGAEYGDDDDDYEADSQLHGAEYVDESQHKEIPGFNIGAVHVDYMGRPGVSVGLTSQ